MARQRPLSLSPRLAAALLAGSGCCAASAAPPSDKPALAAPMYAVFSLADIPSTGPAVGLNNRGEIVFQGGDVYRWSGGALEFEHATFGGVVPSHVEYEMGKKPTERIGHVVPDSFDPLAAVDINDTGDVLGTSRVGLCVWQLGNGEGPVADVLVPNADPDTLSPSTHGRLTGGLNNRHGVVGGLEVLLPPSRENTYFYWQSGVTSDLEAALAALSKDSGAVSFPAAPLEDYEAALPTVDGMSFNPAGLNDAGEIAGTATAATQIAPTPVKGKPRRNVIGSQTYSFHINSVPMPPTFQGTGVFWFYGMGGGGWGSFGGESAAVQSKKPKRHVRVVSAPAYWDGRHLKLLPMEDGASDGSALGINKSHDAVGFERGALNPDDEDQVSQIAVEWRDGVSHDLNASLPPASGWKLTRAARINDDGEIIGEGLYNGVRASFLLVPLPDALQAAPAPAATGSETPK